MGARGGSVLVIEDDEALLTLFERILIEAGFEFRAATTTEGARALIARRRFDIVVCDLSVPGEENVFDFISGLRKQIPRIAALIITGFAPDEVLSQAKTLKMDVLEKPFSPPDLIQRICCLLDRKAA